MNQNYIELSEANFDQEVLGAMQPVLVGFWAGWSESCKALAPMLETVAEDYSAPIKIASVDVETQERLTQMWGVRAVPTVLIFNRGGLQDQIVGRTTVQAVRESLDRLN